MEPEIIVPVPFWINVSFSTSFSSCGMSGRVTTSRGVCVRPEEEMCAWLVHTGSRKKDTRDGLLPYFLHVQQQL